MKENASKLGVGAGLFGSAGLAGFFAVQFLLLAFVLGLIDTGLRGWVAALLVGAVLGAVAGLLAFTGRKTVAGAHLAPSATIEQVQTDAEMLERDIRRIGRRS